MTESNRLTEEAIADLQVRVSFQEDTLNALNSVIADQDAVIARLQQQLQVLNRKLDDLAHSMEKPHASGQEPPPPHY